MKSIEINTLKWQLKKAKQRKINNIQNLKHDIDNVRKKLDEVERLT